MSDTAKGFIKEMDEAFQSAFHAAKGGDPKWDATLQSYGAEPLPQADREKLLNSEMKITRGAFPIELRRIFEKIAAKYPNDSNGFDMDSKILEYYQKIKPFSGLGDIFKNASTGTAKYSQGLQGERHKTYKCKNCGAPRLEEMQYDDCMFCGSKLFVTA
jgi:DNA-directed RNA polymerase subunit RPC12/RpoP